MEDEEILHSRDHEYCSSPFKISSFDCDSEGLKYVGGYVASKFLAKFPFLGKNRPKVVHYKKQLLGLQLCQKGDL